MHGHRCPASLPDIDQNEQMAFTMSSLKLAALGIEALLYEPVDCIWVDPMHLAGWIEPNDSVACRFVCRACTGDVVLVENRIGLWMTPLPIPGWVVGEVQLPNPKRVEESLSIDSSEVERGLQQ